MNRILSLSACAAIVCVAHSASAQNTPLTLFPLKQGTTWTFSTNIAGRNIVQDVVVTEVKGAGSAKTATLDYKANGSSVQTEVYQIDGKGISRLKAGVGGSGTVTPALLVIPARITPGAKWTWKGMINTQGKNIPGSADFTLMAPEAISVPAGKFNAYRVRFFLTMTAPKGTPANQPQSVKIENSYWFAPNVGIVKQEVKIGGQAITGILTKYKVAK